MSVNLSVAEGAFFATFMLILPLVRQGVWVDLAT